MKRELTPQTPIGVSEASFERTLARTLARSEGENGEFQPWNFLSQWSREEGSAYFFLFRKNLQVTNIQYAELMALLRCHVAHSAVHNLQFGSGDTYTRALAKLVSALPRDGKRYADFAKMYRVMFARLVVLDCFNGSCGVFLPPGVKLDLASMCAESGYIHSCGRSVFTMKIDEAQPKNLLDALERYLSTQSRSKKLVLVPYAHEDFSKHDRQYAGDLASGLDDVKVHLDKFFIGSVPLPTVLQQLKRRFASRLLIPEPGERFGDAYKKLCESGDTDRTRILWLISDRMNATLDHGGGQDRYYICYEQQFKNENPFQVCDENKPAWTAHTTLPHTLASALINITRPGWPRRRSVRIIDPFVGSGTVWLETLKFSNVVGTGGDVAPIAPLLAADNLRFFAMSSGDLKRIAGALRQSEKEGLVNVAISADAKETTKSVAEHLMQASAIFRDIDQIGAIDPILSKSIVRRLGRISLITRLLFYVLLKARIRHRVALQRKAEYWPGAYADEISALADQIDDLVRVRTLEEAGRGRRHWRSKVEFQGEFSQACSVSAKSLVSAMRQDLPFKTIDVMDARRLPRRRYDVVIADPPYGFNTQQGRMDLAKLYAQIVPSMVDAVVNNGQIVICVPDRVYTRPQLPFFIHPEVLTSQVLAAAEQLGRRIVMTADAVPNRLFRPPYYWESRRALRRAILHFTIGDV